MDQPLRTIVINKLNLILWGIVIINIDISYFQTTNGVGFRIGLTNDLIRNVTNYLCFGAIRIIEKIIRNG